MDGNPRTDAASAPPIGPDAVLEAVFDTLCTFDELSLRWGTGRRVSLAVFGLDHTEVHALGGEPIASGDSSADEPLVVGAHLRSPFGWECAFVGAGDPDCLACLRLLKAALHEESGGTP